MISARTLNDRKRHLDNILSDEKVKPQMLAKDTSRTTALNMTSTKSSRIQSNNNFPTQMTSSIENV